MILGPGQLVIYIFSNESGLSCSKLWLNLTTSLANQWLNLITVGYLTSGQIFVAQNEFNQWLANHWLNDTNHWLNDLTSG